ncbi:hypothetical protein GCM10009789_69740 [Kribbella sancticallisti]|uniref:Uncharacterized protein n=1 Tax=Kribbella sancticallisti TaxID=460087 RepID=A0ABP4QCW5_9ACTN
MRDNGLTAAAYTSMGGIDPLVAEPVLSALAEAGIAAYCGPPAEPDSSTTSPPVADATGTTAAPPTAAAAAGAQAESADGAAEAGGPPSITEPSGAEGDATADPSPGRTDAEAPAAAKADATAPAHTPIKADQVEPVNIPAGFEEIFVDADSEERARAVIERSTEDAEWKSLVEQFNAPSAEGHDATPVPRWPASEDVDENSYEPLIDVPAGLVVGDTDEDPPEPPPARRTDDPHDHFVPPEPPKGPRLDWISRLAWLGLVGGPALLILAALLDFGTGRITTLAVVGFVGGFLTLVLRMKDRLPPDDTPDDGAVV